MIQKGNLYLFPTPLGDNAVNEVIPDFNIGIMMQLDIFIVEELRTARRFLRKSGYTRDFDTVTFHLLNEHTHPEELTSYLDEAMTGKNIGLLSEAGCPAIADPGAQIVSLAHEKNIRVIPLTGPSSIILSLMASGLNGQQFTFHGYLPAKPDERKLKIRELERISLKQSHTQIFIEAPYRNKQMIDTLLETCNEHTLLCIASNITLPDESIHTKTIKEWRKSKPDQGKKPTVYLLL